jgi:hypothetical protein
MTSDALTILTLRVPKAHAEAVRAYAAELTSTTRVRVTASAAGAAILEAGLVALGRVPAPKPAARKGAKRPAGKP